MGSSGHKKIPQNHKPTPSTGYSQGTQTQTVVLFYSDKTDAPFPYPAPQALKFDLCPPAVTLEIRARSPKPNQVFIMPQYYIHANLFPICQLVHERY